MNVINLIATVDTIAQLTRLPKTFNERTDPFLMPDDQFKARYRFNKRSVEKITKMIKTDIELNSRGYGTSAQLQVLVSLHCWGQRKIQDDAADIHGLSQPTVCRICARVAQALANLAKMKIQMPQSTMEEQTVMSDFMLLKNFPEVIGAIDETQIKIKKIGGDLSKYYLNCNGYYSLNVQMVCDAKLIIRDVEARWEGSTEDCRIFNQSTIKQRFENHEFIGRMVGDSGYKLWPYLFTPLLRPQNDKENRYNIAHIATRKPVEDCLAIWKKRFRCLLDGLRVNLDNAKILIIALAVLHNIAIVENDTVPDDDYRLEKMEQKIQENKVHNFNDDVENEGGDENAIFVLKTFIQEHF
ncbi:hypothetical protein DOY81_002410 [Sarcophaga bullata]|nr:hypothetical protein DOY81_002410 [Sarcophaga bullata]